MTHRHLNHQELTLAAIDDIIARGNRQDWAELRRAVLSNPEFFKKILQVCRAHIVDPRAQRYHFWMHYAEEKWQDWNRVKKACAHCATTIFDRVSALEPKRKQRKKAN
jgi:hypothetical protein